MTVAGVTQVGATEAARRGGQRRWALFQSWNTGDWSIKHTAPPSEGPSEVLGRVLDCLELA